MKTTEPAVLMNIGAWVAPPISPTLVTPTALVPPKVYDSVPLNVIPPMVKVGAVPLVMLLVKIAPGPEFAETLSMVPVVRL